jgi:hypothetical protein
MASGPSAALTSIGSRECDESLHFARGPNFEFHARSIGAVPQRKGFFFTHGFAPTTTYDLVRDQRRYPPKAILATAHEFATGQRLASGDFEGGKTGAVKVLGELGFTVKPRRPAS